MPRMRRPACRDHGRSRGAAAIERLSRIARGGARGEALSAARQGVRGLQAGAGRLRRRAGGAVRRLRVLLVLFGGLARAREALLRDGAPAFRPRTRAVSWSSSRATTAICCANFLEAGIPVLGIDPSDTVARRGGEHRRADPGRVLRRVASAPGSPARAGAPISSSRTTCSRTCRGSTISSQESRGC